MNEATMNEATMNEDSQEGAKDVFEKKIDPGFAKNVKIIAGVGITAIVVVVGLFVFMKPKSTVDTNVNMMAARGGPSQTTGAEPTPAMDKKLSERQSIEAKEAEKRGATYFPKESIGKTTPVETPAEVKVEPQPYGGSQYRPALQADPSDQMRLAGLKRQLDAIFPDSKNQSGSGELRQTLSGERGQQQMGGLRQSLDQAGSPASATGTLNQGRKVITALEIHVGEMANPINVGQGKTSFASARITSGRFSGAYLIGTATLNDEETIETKFTDMRYGNQSFKIDAIVLDEQTADAGLRGDIDRRILQRYVLPVTLGTVQGYVTAKSQAGTTVVIGAGGATQMSTPVPTEDQAVNAGIAVGLQQAQSDVQKEAQKPIRGATRRGLSVGILFRSDVMEGVSK